MNQKEKQAFIYAAMLTLTNRLQITGINWTKTSP